jgi:hypothetical protein
MSRENFFENFFVIGKDRWLFEFMPLGRRGDSGAWGEGFATRSKNLETLH